MRPISFRRRPARRATSMGEINEAFREEAASERYRGVLGVSDDPLVSSDIIGRLTRVGRGPEHDPRGRWHLGEGNELVRQRVGFTHQMVRQAKEMLVVRASA